MARPQTRVSDPGTSEPLKLAFALRRALAQGYSMVELRTDVMAGLVVGIVALPLSMALAIASGVAPQHGLYTAIVAGALIALLGGSRTQVSGPTAAFVTVLAPIAATFGLGGLALATAMAGLLLIVLGVARLGRLVEFVPYPVTTGFTAGIALVIATLQVKDFLGLRVETSSGDIGDRLASLVRALPGAHLPDLAIGALTLALLVLWPRWPRFGVKVPSPLVALTVAAVVAALLAHWLPGFSVDTIQSRFSYEIGGGVHPGIPRVPPVPQLPWRLPGADGRPLALSYGLVHQLAGPAFAIAMLGAIESLLSAVVADGMTRHRHDPDAELIAQGVGNLVAPFFGGIAATGAIARTATNVRSGGRSPVAAMVHSAVVLAAMVALAPLLGRLPMASLAALLLVVAWNMSEARHVVRTIRVAPKSDVLVLLCCLTLTVTFDMVVAVVAGILLAALLFMRRMAAVSGVELVGPRDRSVREPLPAGVLVYRIAGPLFFGAAQKAMGALHTVDPAVRFLVLDLSAVPALDATGLFNLDSAISRLHEGGVLVLLGGLQEQPLRALLKGGWRQRRHQVMLFHSIDAALTTARRLGETAA